MASLLVLLLLVLTLQMEGMAAALPLSLQCDVTPCVRESRHSTSVRPTAACHQRRGSGDSSDHAAQPSGSGRYFAPDAELGKLIEVRLGSAKSNR